MAKGEASGAGQNEQLVGTSGGRAQGSLGGTGTRVAQLSRGHAEGGERARGTRGGRGWGRFVQGTLMYSEQRELHAQTNADDQRP